MKISSKVRIFMVVFLATKYVCHGSKVKDESIIADSRKLSILKFISRGIHGMLWDELLQNGLSSELKLSEQCRETVQYSVKAMNNNELWALKMLDANGKAESAVLEGTVAVLGDYDQCLHVHSKGTDREFEGAYCLVSLESTLETRTPNVFGNFSMTDEENLENHLTRMPYKYAACLPSLCSPEDVRAILSYYLEPQSWKVSENPFCSTRASRSFRYGDLSMPKKLSCIFIGAVVGTVLLATLLDLLQFGHTKLNIFLIKSWSITNNWKELWSREDHAAGRAPFIDICRLVFLMVEIPLHSTVISGLHEAIFLTKSHDVGVARAKDISLQALVGTTSHQMMYALSGVSLSLSSLKLLNEQTVISSGLKLIFRKWWRLQPILLCLICLQILMPLTASGPAFDFIMEKRSEICTKTSWTTFLLVTNWFNLLDMCVPVLWSNSVDFQLFAILVLCVMVLSKWKRLGITLVAILTIVGCILPTYYMYEYNLRPLGVAPLYPNEFLNQFKYLHFSTSSQLTSFMLPFFALYARFAGFRVPLAEVSRNEEAANSARKGVSFHLVTRFLTKATG